MPSRVPSLTDKEIENANTSTYVWIERARAWAWLYSHVSRPPNLNPPIFLFTLVGANPPNLMPAKFSGYTVVNEGYHTITAVNYAEVDSAGIDHTYGYIYT